MTIMKATNQLTCVFKIWNDIDSPIIIGANDANKVFGLAAKIHGLILSKIMDTF